MTTQSETEALEEYLYANPEHLVTAQVIHESWASIKDKICEKFLKNLRDRFNAGVEENCTDGICIDCSYSENGRYATLWLYRSLWRQYEEGEPDRGKRTAICLQAQSVGPKAWGYGVASPLERHKMSEGGQGRHTLLEKELKQAMGGSRKNDPWWPIYSPVAEKNDWNKFVPKLHQECQKNGGEITDYYVSLLVDFAAKAIPIIDKIETESE